MGRGGRYEQVHPPRQRRRDPSPLKVKQVWVQERRYIVCLNEEQARKDAADREAILASQRDRLRQGSVSLVGNRGYRRYLRSHQQGFAIDAKRVAADERYDGK